MPKGVKFKPDREAVMEAIDVCGGQLEHVARKFKVRYATIWNYCKADPELRNLVADSRGDYDEESLDMAYDVLRYAMSEKKKKLTQALSAAFYILNRKGYLRGFLEFTEAEQRQKDAFSQFMGTQKERAKAEKVVPIEPPRSQQTPA